MVLGPEVRECYVEGLGFITALGIHKDNTGTALARTLAIARAIGGLRQGAIEMTPRQEAVLDLAVEQVLAPAMARVSMSFVELMSKAGIPLEAIMTELMLSGEVERNYRLLRLEGYAGQMRYHSPTSQYGQMSRADRYDGLDVPRVMREVLSEIESGKFADEWQAERDAGYPNLQRCGPRSSAPRSSPSRRTCAPASANGPSLPPADPEIPPSRPILREPCKRWGPGSAEGRMTAIAACRTCGTEPLENARFCHGCGSPVQNGDTRAEYKQVTVLFADVVHSMDIASAVGAERLREIMARAGGSGRCCGETVWRDGGQVHRRRDHGACSARRWRWRTTRCAPAGPPWGSIGASAIWPLRCPAATVSIFSCGSG